MDIEPVLTKTSALVEQKLRSLVSGQPPTFTTATFRVKSTRPLQIEDADGLVMPCQNDAPQQLTIGIYPLTHASCLLSMTIRWISRRLQTIRSSMHT